MRKGDPICDLKALIDLFERTRRGDQDARASMKGWFDARAASMREGKQAREELGTLAYLVAEKDATRKLASNGRFGDLPNSPGSVASQHWERFQPFCEDLEQGSGKTVDDFVIRVNALTRYVLLDMVKQRDRDNERRQPFDDGVDAEGIEDDEGPAGDHSEWLERKQALLARIYLVLPPRQFVVVILKDYCDFKWTQIAVVLDTTVYRVKGDHARAIRSIGENLA